MGLGPGRRAPNVGNPRKASVDGTSPCGQTAQPKSHCPGSVMVVAVVVMVMVVLGLGGGGGGGAWWWWWWWWWLVVGGWWW